MAYISRVKNTANQHFELHDSRLGEGQELNVTKDWSVNDTQSSDYIKNRTHYTNNRFELINLEWYGYFPADNGPETVTLDTKLLYQLSKVPLTTEEITSTFIGKTFLYYKPVSGTIDRGTLQELFPNETYILQTEWIDQSTQNVQLITYGFDNGTTSASFGLYNVGAEQEVEIDSTTITLQPGIYALGFDSVNYDGISVIRHEDNIVELPEKYIPASIINRIETLEGAAPSLVTKTYVDTAINGVTTSLNEKMNKTSPTGNGNLILLDGNNNIPACVYITGDFYADYDPNDSSSQKKLATEAFVTTSLATKMDATKRIFDSLYIGDTLLNNRVLTTADISTIQGAEFIGLFALEEYLPSNNVELNDYAYVLDTYSTGSHAQVSKYIYTQEGWERYIYYSNYFIIENNAWISKALDQIDQTIYTLTDTIDHNPIMEETPITGYSTTTIYVQNIYTIIGDTFTPAQWKNINTDVDTVLSNLGVLNLVSRVEELEAKVNAMFEFAEGQEF